MRVNCLKEEPLLKTLSDPAKQALCRRYAAAFRTMLETLAKELGRGHQALVEYPLRQLATNARRPCPGMLDNLR